MKRTLTLTIHLDSRKASEQWAIYDALNKMLQLNAGSKIEAGKHDIPCSDCGGPAGTYDLQRTN